MDSKDAIKEQINIVSFKFDQKVSSSLQDWSEAEFINLVYLVNKLGRSAWRDISTKFRKYFKNRKSRELSDAYHYLEERN